MRVAVIGKGNVGSAIGPKIAAAGHQAVYGVRDPSDPKYSDSQAASLTSVADAAASAEIVILAVHWGSVDDVLAECGDLAGKILVDCTNPYDFQNSLKPLVASDESAGQIIASKTRAKVVKAFNQVGADAMAHAGDNGVRPLQFVASDDEASRTEIIRLAHDIGFDARDAGGLEYARELEGMARLWVAQAFRGMPAALPGC
jgi:predicted dinucleotide-binding enzyme